MGTGAEGVNFKKNQSKGELKTPAELVRAKLLDVTAWIGSRRRPRVTM